VKDFRTGKNFAVDRHRSADRRSRNAVLANNPGSA